MTPLSWIYMGLVWAAIIALNAFCFYRIFGRKKHDNKDAANRGDHGDRSG